MTHATDIVGYSYQADTYCPTCTTAMVRRNAALPLSFWNAAPANADIETTLDYYATHVIPDADRYDETTFDTEDFPKVIFSSQVESPEHCGACHEEL